MGDANLLKSDIIRKLSFPRKALTMLKSMTAFARNEKTFDWGRVVCELRAVNHRYLDMSFKL